MEVTETLNQENATESAEETQETVRTFTQEEVDKIINKRFKEFKSLEAKAQKYDELQEASKSELEKATEKANKLQAQLNELTKANEIRAIKEKISVETGVPVSLLAGDTEEACKEQAEAILAFAKPTGYPAVKDGGEINNIPKKTEADQFADWFSASLNNN